MKMSNAKIKQNSSGDFTGTNIDVLKRACEGIPIFIDDLDKTQFTNHAGKIIKDDDWGIEERFINYPAIAITTNELPALKDYISKRAVGCHINIKVEKETGLRNAKKLNDSFKHVTNSFFCEYVRRMLDRIFVLSHQVGIDRLAYGGDAYLHLQIIDNSLNLSLGLVRLLFVNLSGHDARVLSVPVIADVVVLGSCA